jgi:hypothetical protein
MLQLMSTAVLVLVWPELVVAAASACSNLMHARNLRTSAVHGCEVAHLDVQRLIANLHHASAAAGSTVSKTTSPCKPLTRALAISCC